ncbi:hypothetical protein TOC8172_16150 [Pseudomonas syringae]
MRSDIFAKEHHVRLEPFALAMRAFGHLETGFVGGVQQGVTIGCLGRMHIGQVQIVRQHLLLNGRTVAALLTIQAQHAVQAAVQLDNVLAAGLGVQRIDILRDQPFDEVFSL